ncbi:hypothetical protein N7509_010442 [Penicillium cosmopolitanum]|uniref:Uncharacterized protein n=1 Tax=Penicillium cosmopolitanum TaxID=1131564 RepID=A0A9W9VR97_9EURO|nr:uncharacterized protein N7509_010442 [Penicillium cosmopolitanum]KAJ5387901.1 hypothetical protein N7509_010442 [Penicillium cosmopolitanum]
MSRYAAAHIDPQGPGDARPTALQIVQDEGFKGKLTGKVAVVTGVSSGLGIETVRALAATGATLYLTARNLEKAEAALADIFDSSTMTLVQMDQASLESVRIAAQTILSQTSQISLLIANAGVMAIPDLKLTDKGHEMQFATNHLSHFLFFNLLKSALLAGSSSAFHSRVVMLSSAGHRVGGINSSDNYHYQNGGYNPWAAYAQSKTANVYMANEIERRYGLQGLHAYSLNPGIAATGIIGQLSSEEIMGMLQDEAMLKAQKNLDQGAATTIYAAISRDLEDGDRMSGKSAPHAFDPENEARLWKDSLELVGLSD